MTIQNLTEVLSASNYSHYSFTDEFNAIIKYKCQDYDTIKSFLEDVQNNGCMSGLINDFVYHSDCKDFYIKHIDDLEDLRSELEEQIGEQIPNRFNLPHYTFMCWLAFEEYCNDIYNNYYEN